MSMERTTIPALTRDCLVSWNELILNDLLHRDAKCTYEEQRARFSLWVASLGVFDSGQNSIMYRLRYNVVTERLVQQWLMSLRSNVRYCCKCSGLKSPTSEQQSLYSHEGYSAPAVDVSIQQLIDAGDPYTERTEVSTNLRKNPLVFAHHRIDDGIENLILLSTLVREHGVAKGRGRAFQYVPKDQNGNSVVAEFTSYAQLALERELGPQRSQELLYLKERLLCSIVERWRRISYRGKQSTRVHRTMDAPVMSLRATPNEFEDFLNDQAGGRLPPADQRIAESHHSESQVATSVPESFVMPTARQLLPVSSTIPGSSMGQQRLEIPDPPANVIQKAAQRHGSGSGLKEFLCPYCSILQQFDPTSKKGKKVWRGHVLHDLEPYVCLHQHCDQAERAFSDFKHWLHHMKDDHASKSWSCQQCNASDHFDSRDAFLSHLEQRHSSHMSREAQLLLADLTVLRKSVKFANCIFCGLTAMELGNGAMIPSLREEELQEKMYQHMRHHLRNIALMSLPWASASADIRYADSNKPEHTSTNTAGQSDDEDSGHDEESALKKIEELFTSESSYDPTAAWIGSVPDVQGEDGKDQFEAEQLRQGLPALSNHNESPETLLQNLAQARTICFEIVAGHKQVSKSFVPRSKVEELLTPNVVDSVLQAKCSRPISVNSLSVLRHSPRGLCILLEIEYSHHIPHFVRCPELRDNQLPLTSRPSRFPRDRDIWERFFNLQWQYFPVALDISYSEWNDMYILPYLEKEHLANGSRAKLYKITLAREYDGLFFPGDIDETAPGNRQFALKTYKGEHAQSYYNNEVGNYTRLNEAEEGFPAGLTEMHTGYQHGDTYNVVFELANGGNLHDMMLNTEPPATGRQIHEFWKALLELLKALERIYEIEEDFYDRGRNVPLRLHQDVTPKKILVFLAPATEFQENPHQAAPSYSFKLANLGIDRFVSAAEGPRNALAKDKFGTQTFGAPETFREPAYGQRSSTNVTQSMDIWSLGCIFLTAAVWIVFGSKGVQDFQRARLAENNQNNSTAADCFHNGQRPYPKLLQVVHEELKALRMELKRSDFTTPEVMDLLVDPMIDPDPNRRHTATAACGYARRALVAAETSSSRHRSAFLHYPSQTMPTQVSEPRPAHVYTDAIDFSRFQLADEPDIHNEIFKDPLEGTSDVSWNRFRGLYTSPEKHVVRSSGTSPSAIQNATHQGQITTRQISPVHVYTPPPRQNATLSVEQALRYIAEASKIYKFPKLENAHYRNFIKGRDHVLLLDDSSSMKDYEQHVLLVAKALLYFANAADRDGVDILCTNSDRKWHSKDLKSLMEFVKARMAAARGTTDIKVRLGSILAKYRAELQAKEGIAVTKLSVYVLTDGAWTGVADAERLILNTVQTLTRFKMRSNQLGIQFVSFGDDPQAMERLEKLDKLGKDPDVGLDIVDTTDHRDNVWKMLLGAIDKTFDDDAGWSGPSRSLTMPAAR